MTDNNNAGHRQRLRERFLKGEEGSHTDGALLELLLTYALPQKDVQPLAKKLIDEFGSFSNVLGADVEQLCSVGGIKDNAAILLKLVDYLRESRQTKLAARRAEQRYPLIKQSTLFEPPTMVQSPLKIERARAAPIKKARSQRRGTGLFGKAILKEAIEMLPQLPETESLEDVRAFLKSNLHFSAEQTRQRYAEYIVRRMFLNGHADYALRAFAGRYKGRQELRDVCFYRFCKAEPLMYKVVDDLFIPGIGAGRLNRERLRDYLAHQYPAAKSIKDSAQAITEALADSGVAKVDRTKVTFGYREILIPSFAFVVHNEFPEPGMYSIERLESSPALRALFWNPDRVLGSLYELRNQGLIAKVSEIDSVRQFTTKWDLDHLVERLVSERVGA